MNDTSKLSRSKSDLDQCLKLYDLINGKVRYKILYQIAKHEKITVKELAEFVSISQPKCSMHLSNLSDAGIITGEKIGRYVYYSLNKELFDFIMVQSRAIVAGLKQHN